MNKTLSKQERTQKKEKQERVFSIVALIIVAVTALVILGIIVNACIKQVQKVEADELYGCWYSVDGESCWRFGEDEDVYFFGRKGETEPYLFSSYTDYVFDEKASSVTIYFGKGNPVAFTCTLRGDKLTMKSSDSTLVFRRGIDISTFNKDIVSKYPPVEQSPSPEK